MQSIVEMDRVDITILLRIFTFHNTIEKIIYIYWHFMGQKRMSLQKSNERFRIEKHVHATRQVYTGEKLKGRATSENKEEHQTRILKKYQS